MEDDLKKLKMEDDLKKLKIKDNLKKVENGGRPQFLSKDNGCGTAPGNLVLKSLVVNR